MGRHDAVSIYRRQNQWLDNNLKDLLRVYGAKIKEPKPEPESGAEWDTEDGSVKTRTKGKIRRMLETRINEMLSDLKHKKLNEEQAGILSVITGEKKDYKIRINDLGEIVAFLRGNRDRTGAGHIMLKHFGKNARMGYVSADEILEIGNIIRGGELKIVNENERRYTVNDKNYPGRKLTVVVKKSLKKGFPDFVFTFFSNKKAEDVLAKKASGQTLTVLPSSTVKQDLNSFPKSQENFYGDLDTEAFEGNSGRYIIDGVGSVDPQGRNN